MRRAARRARVVLATAVAGSVPLAAADSPERVPREALVAAMRAEQGYDRTVTPNLARFQAGVLLRLAQGARARAPEGPPLLIHHEDYFQAYLEALGLETSRAPLPVRLSHEHRHDALVEHRPGRVLRRVVKGPAPELALSVRWTTSWREAPESYSYEDTRSRPQLKVTVAREVRYRLLQLQDQIVYDEIEGISGRPTTGVLALLFRLIGEARATSSRIAIAPDGWQVARGRGRKGLLSGSATVSVSPDGTADRDVPPNRPDLARLLARLEQPIEYEYVPWPAP